MNTTRKMLLSLVLALMLGGVFANAAYAFHCTNPNLNGKALVGEFNIATETFTAYKDNGTVISAEEFRINGAWVKLIFPWGESYNVLVRTVLPDGAMDAGPGIAGCDGKGIDDLDACLTIPGP